MSFVKIRAPLPCSALSPVGIKQYDNFVQRAVMNPVNWIFGPRWRAPEAELVYAIGDIHGRDDLLALIHEQIEAEIQGNNLGCSVTVVYLGDYVDRGPSSKGVVDRLLDSPIRGARSIHLKGNHEDVLLRFLESGQMAREWLSMGGGATVNSYGVSLRSGSTGQIPLEDVGRSGIGAVVVIFASPNYHLVAADAQCLPGGALKAMQQRKRHSARLR